VEKSEGKKDRDDEKAKDSHSAKINSSAHPDKMYFTP